MVMGFPTQRISTYGALTLELPASRFLIQWNVSREGETSLPKPSPGIMHRFARRVHQHVVVMAGKPISEVLQEVGGREVGGTEEGAEGGMEEGTGEGTVMYPFMSPRSETWSKAWHD